MPSSPIANCRFSYECPQQLSALRTTADPDVYFCPQCQENVYRCHDPQQLIQHSQLGRCVVFEYEPQPCELAQGDVVQVTSGHFLGFDMEVVGVNHQQQTASLLPRNIFGRILPIEVNFSEIVKPTAEKSGS